MVRYPEPRAVRRAAKRAERAARAAERAAQHPLGDPRAGEDRRGQERRSASLTPEQLEARLRALGISTDRRRGQRRGGDRRR